MATPSAPPPPYEEAISSSKGDFNINNITKTTATTPGATAATTADTFTSDNLDQSTSTSTKKPNLTATRSWRPRQIQMVSAKLTYFFSQGYMGCITPFLDFFFLSYGLSITNVLLINGISYTCASITSPLCSMLIDFTGHQKIIWLLLCFGTIASVFSVPWVSDAVAAYDVTKNVTACDVINHSLAGNDSVKSALMTRSGVMEDVIQFGNRAIENMLGIQNSRPVGTLNSTLAAAHPSSQQHLTDFNEFFYTLLFISIICKIFFVTVPNYIDGMAVIAVKAAPQGSSYGHQRVFGTLGFSITNFLTAFVIDRYKSCTQFPYSIAFYVFLPCALLLIPCGHRLICHLPRYPERRRYTMPEFRQHLITLLSNLDTFLMLVTVAVAGIALNIFHSFIAVYLAHDLNATHTPIALTTLTTTLVQLICYPLAHKVIKLTGAIPVVIIGILAYCPRFILLTYITNPWLAIPIQLLDPVALAWTAQLEYIYAATPKEISFTVIHTVASIRFVVGNVVASAFGGLIFYNLGGRVLYCTVGVACGVWGVLVAAYFGVKSYRRRRVFVVDATPRDVYWSEDITHVDHIEGL